MAAHQHWRAVALEAYGTGDLELSEFHLLAAGTRADAPATLTASAAPDVSGVLANLKDDVLTTAARWSAKAVKTLVLSWDFGGAPADITDIRLAGASLVRFPLIAKIQWSDDASAWADLVTFAGIAWPGAGVKTNSVAGLIATNTVKGRAEPIDLDVVGGGPVMVYGSEALLQTVKLSVSGGAIKDVTSGLLGQGIGRVRGTVKETGTPTSPVFRRVRLIRERDGFLIREVWSDKVTGAYDFTYVDELQTWTVVSYDHNHNYRAVVADNLTLANGGVELMP